MPKSYSDPLRSLAWPTYLVALLLVATPALDFVSNVWPLRFGNAEWRYGSAGLLAGFLLTPLFGIMFALGAAVILRHRLVVKTLSIINIVSAVCLVILVVFFALDVLQVRANVQVEARGMFQVGAAKATLKHLTMACALTWLGFVGIKVSSSSNARYWSNKKKADVQLVRSEDAPPQPVDTTS